MHFPLLHCTVTPPALQEQVEPRDSSSRAAEGLEEERAMGEAATRPAATRMRMRVACMLIDLRWILKSKVIGWCWKLVEKRLWVFK